MSKRLYFSFFILLLTILMPIKGLSLNWIIDVNYVSTTENATYKIVNNIPIKYFIEERDNSVQKESTSQKVKDEIANAVKEKEKFAYFNYIIQNGFNAWLRDTKNMIEEEGRKQEFTDIMPILNKKVLLREVKKKEDADMVFVFTDIENLRKECCSEGIVKNCGGCFSRGGYIVLESPFISGDKEGVVAAAIHEIGHYYGLGDEYIETRFFSNDYVYSTSAQDRRAVKGSVMASSNNEFLHCDDVDGFINLIDFTLAKQNNHKFSKRAQQSWASFCNGKKIPILDKPYKETFYKESKVLNKPDYFNSSDLTLTKFDKDGNIEKQFFFDPLDFRNREIQEFTQEGLIKRVIDRENKIQFSYKYTEGNIEINSNYFGPNASFGEIYKKPWLCTRSKNESSWECDSHDLYSELLKTKITLHGENCSVDEGGIVFNYDGNDNLTIRVIRDKTLIQSLYYKEKVLPYYYIYTGISGRIFYYDSDICKVVLSNPDNYENEISLDFNTGIINVKNEEKLDEWWADIPDASKYREEYMEDFNNKCNILGEEGQRHREKCIYLREVEKHLFF